MAALREIFRSRIGGDEEENVWDPGFGIPDFTRGRERLLSEGAAATRASPRRHSRIYTCGAYVYLRERIANCCNAASTEGLTEGERQKNEMIELCLIAACCSSSIDRTRTEFIPALPNFADPSYCRCPLAVIVLEVEDAPSSKTTSARGRCSIAGERFPNSLRSFLPLDCDQLIEYLSPARAKE